MISVAMCTYNGAAFLKEQLQSIISQTVPPDEIVICDDCSKDNTIEVAKSVLSQWQGTVKIIENEHNLGYKMNFQKAISLCEGDLIFLSDQDDIWRPKKIEHMKMVFAKHPEAQLVFHDVELVDEQLRPIAPSFWQILHFNAAEFLHGCYDRLLLGNVVQGSACAFRRGLFEKAYPFPKEAVHDEWLALVATLFGSLIPITEPLMKYRQGHNQIGGEERSFKRGVQLWKKNARSLTMKHIKQLNDRISVLSGLKQRYQQNVKKTFGKKIDDSIIFYERRLKFVLYKAIIPSFKSYFVYCISIKQAFRQIFKDIFSRFISGNDIYNRS